MKRTFARLLEYFKNHFYQPLQTARIPPWRHVAPDVDALTLAAGLTDAVAPANFLPSLIDSSALSAGPRRYAAGRVFSE